MKVIDLSKVITDEFINNIFTMIPAPQYTMKYKKKDNAIFSKDLTSIIYEDSMKEFDDNVHSMKGHAFVYLLYKDDKVEYVGKGIDIRDRIKNHLIKNYEGTNAKIKKVIENLNNDIDTTIQYSVLDIIPHRFYSAIEGLLIDHYNTIDDGWNEKNG